MDIALGQTQMVVNFGGVAERWEFRLYARILGASGVISQRVPIKAGQGIDLGRAIIRRESAVEGLGICGISGVSSNYLYGCVGRKGAKYTLH